MISDESNQYLILGSLKKFQKSFDYDTGNLRVLKITETKSKFQKLITFQFHEIQCLNLPGAVFCCEKFKEK